MTEDKPKTSWTKAELKQIRDRNVHLREWTDDELVAYLRRQEANKARKKR